jgi:hypothetical protein
MANASIPAQIIVIPGRISIFCFRLSSPSCRSISVANSKRSDREKQSDRQHRDQQSERTGDVVFDGDRAIFPEPITQKSPGRGRGF